VVTPLRGRHRASGYEAVTAAAEPAAEPAATDQVTPIPGRHRSSEPIQPPVLTVVPPLCHAADSHAQ